MATMLGVFVLESTWRSWDETDYRTYGDMFASAGATRFVTEAFTYDPELIDAVHNAGMEFWGGIACFSDHGRPSLAPEIDLTPITPSGQPRTQMEWYTGLRPTSAAHNDALAAHAADLVARYELDGIGFDFLRWPLHWELELRPSAERDEASFDRATLRQFAKWAALPLDLADLDTATAARWILDNAASRWTDFKVQVITDVAILLQSAVTSVDPTIRTGVYVVPGDPDQRRRLLGQDTRALGAVVDELFPMVYHNILHRPLRWAIAVTEEVRSGTESRVLPVLQIEAANSDGWDWGPAMTRHDKEAAHAAARTDPVGAVLFPGEALIAI